MLLALAAIVVFGGVSLHIDRLRHVLGARHPTRIRGLVYVDAAFDRGDDADTEAFNAVARTVPTAPSPAAGDMWLWVAIDADSKLVPCFTLGQRNASDAHEVLNPQISST